MSVDNGTIARTRRQLKTLGRIITKDLDRELKSGGEKITEYAKTKRFRQIAGANRTGPRRTYYSMGGAGRSGFGGVRFTNLVNPPIRDIQTARTNQSRRSITFPIRLGLGSYKIVHGVIYAATNEKNRPVLTAALKHFRPIIEKKLGVRLNSTIETRWNR